MVRALASNQLRHEFKSRHECHMWVEFLLCSERFMSGYSGICLSSKTRGEVDWTYCYKSLVPWFLDCLNTTYVGIFYFKQIYRHWNALNAKTNDFDVYSIHFYSGILSIEHSLTFPNSNSTWDGRQRTTMWMPFPLNYLFIYLFIFYYALLDECLTQKTTN